MNKIVVKKTLNSNTTLMTFEAPIVTRHCKAGQFVMLRVHEDGERIPLTIADFDRATGYVTVVFQQVGKTTHMLGALEQGDTICDVAGPLGVPSHLDGIKRACVVGGGLGCAIAYPQAKTLFESGAKVDIIAGFRSADIVFFEDEMRAASDRLFVMTDDGSNGHKGFVTQALKEQLDAGVKYDTVIAIGPLMMMKAVSELTRSYNIHTIVSMNSIMIDGTGMCGGCRVTVGGETKFACVDGPDFDGHQVDFESANVRGRMFQKEEKEAVERHACRLEGMQGGAQ